VNTHEEQQVEVARQYLAVTPEQQAHIESIATNLKQQTPSLFILIVDRNGHILYFNGDGPPQAGLVELAALLAGDLAASQEIARLTGAYQQQQLILREGQQQNSFLAEAGEHLVLFMQTSSEVPLGWARLLIQEACMHLAGLELRVADPASNGQALDSQSFRNNLDKAMDALWD
jgi:hypothetical protein